LIFEVEKGFWSSRPLPHRTKVCHTILGNDLILVLTEIRRYFKASTGPLIITEKILPLDQPEAIIEVLQEIEELCAHPSPIPGSSRKRKAVSGITKHAGLSPVVESETKRLRVG
jgi:hypothetical protein